jgi:hypothetical protein
MWLGQAVNCRGRKQLKRITEILSELRPKTRGGEVVRKERDVNLNKVVPRGRRKELLDP